MNGTLLDLLLSRLEAARDKRAIQGLLRAVNEEHGLPRGELRITGRKDDLLHHIRDGVDRGLISVNRLSALVDRLEENGGQHLFLFDLTPEGVAALQAPTFRSAFASMPSSPAPSMYADIPHPPKIYFAQRDDALVIKQIHAATFWEKDEKQVIRERQRAVSCRSQTSATSPEYVPGFSR